MRFIFHQCHVDPRTKKKASDAPIPVFLNLNSKSQSTELVPFQRTMSTNEGTAGLELKRTMSALTAKGSVNFLLLVLKVYIYIYIR